MCLAIPGQVATITDEGGLRMAEVAYGPVRNRVCLAYLPEAKVGDFVIVHAGFAISILDEAEAAERLAAWREYVEEARRAGMEIPEADTVLQALETPERPKKHVTDDDHHERR